MIAIAVYIYKPISPNSIKKINIAIKQKKRKNIQVNSTGKEFNFNTR